MRPRPSQVFDPALPALIPVSLVVIWEWAVWSAWWPPTLIAAPSEVVVNFFRLAVDGDLFFHSSVSLQRLLLGFLVGSTAGIFLGALVGLSRVIERAVEPTVQMLAPIPVVAWIPLLIILFGIGEASKVALIAVGTFFLIFLQTVQGIRGTDEKFIEVAAVFNKPTRRLMTDVLLPSALPHILTGLRAAFGLSWILLIVAEIIASSAGLGWLIWDARNFSRPDDMIVGMIVVGILGKLSDQALVALQTWLLRWRQSFQGV